MRQKCKNCIHYVIRVADVWYDRLTGEQHRDIIYNNYCLFINGELKNNYQNQYNNCKFYKGRIDEN